MLQVLPTVFVVCCVLVYDVTFNQMFLISHLTSKKVLTIVLRCTAKRWRCKRSQAQMYGIENGKQFNNKKTLNFKFKEERKTKSFCFLSVERKFISKSCEEEKKNANFIQLFLCFFANVK